MPTARASGAPRPFERGHRAVPSTARDHWPFLAVLVAAALPRVATSVAYFPGLTFSDSWTYLVAGLSERLPRFPGWEPIGYPVFLSGVLHVYRGAAAVTALQHLLGVGTGSLI
jgi:hypothetical protein